MGELIRLAKRTWKLSSEQREELARRYADGENSEILSKEYGIAPTNVMRLVHKAGVKTRSASESHRVLPLNEEAFDVLDDDVAYWVGFLMADGGVGAGDIQLNLALEDKGHLYKFRVFLGSGHAITDVPERRWYRRGKLVVNGPAAHFAVCSARLVKALARWGVLPRKSFVAKAVEELVFNRHFWRGVVDGDGCIGEYENQRATKSHTILPRIGLVGSCDLLEQFKVYVERVFGPQDSNVRPMSSIFTIDYSGEFALKLMVHLYKGDEIALDRKIKKVRVVASHNTTAHEDLGTGRC